LFASIVIWHQNKFVVCAHVSAHSHRWSSRYKPHAACVGCILPGLYAAIKPCTRLFRVWTDVVDEQLTAHCFLYASRYAYLNIGLHRAKMHSWHLLTFSLISFSHNDRERKPRMLLLTIIAVYAGTKGAAVKFSSNCERSVRGRKGRWRGKWRRIAEGEDDDAEERNRVRCSRENGTACLA